MWKREDVPLQARHGRGNGNGNKDLLDGLMGPPIPFCTDDPAGYARTMYSQYHYTVLGFM